MSKRAVLLLISILAVSSLIVVESTFAQSIPKPSVPEFTLRYVDYSYDIPPVYGTDQYTGETVIKQYGEHVDKRTIEVKIRNQPFTPYTDGENHTINLFYNVQVRGHFEGTWKMLYGDNAHFKIQDYRSQYTIINYTYAINLRDIPQRGQMDFQVQALTGYEYANRNPSTGWMDPYYFYTIRGAESGWSSTQTLTIPTSTPSSPDSPPPASTPNQTTAPTPEGTPQTLQFEIIIGAVIAIVVCAGLLVYFKKRKH